VTIKTEVPAERLGMADLKFVLMEIERHSKLRLVRQIKIFPQFCPPKPKAVLATSMKI
jgi:hypothetical protein